LNDLSFLSSTKTDMNKKKFSKRKKKQQNKTLIFKRCIYMTKATIKQAKRKEDFACFLLNK
jgi:hypothetical protein